MAPFARRPRHRQAFRLAVRHYRAQLREDWRVTLPSLLLPGIGSTLAWFCPPLVIAAVLERFQDGDKPSGAELTPYLLAFAGVWIGGEMLWRLGIHFVNRAVTRGEFTLQTRGLDALFGKDLAFFHDNFAGSLTKKVVGYGTAYEIFVSTLAFEVSAGFLPLGFAGVVLWQYSPWLIVFLVAMTALTVAVIAPLVLRRQKLVDAREAASTLVAGHVADSLTNIDAVRLFAREPEESATHVRNVEHWRVLALRSWDYQNRRIDLVTAPLHVTTNVVGVLLAVMLAGEGGFSLAAVFVTFTYYSRFSEVMWDFNHIYRNLESQLSTAAQFTELLLDPPVVVDPPARRAPRFADAGVEFRDVWFTYPNRTEPLFAGLDLRIAPGEKVGLVGHSGGGKSTLTRLLLRQADIDAGTIAVGGQDIARVRQADLRGQIAYVPQDPLMFHRSLRDNIAFGRLDASEAEVRAAAEAAHATGFIESLPQGFDTLVGERGVKLSGGQRQRLAIARAVLQRRPDPGVRRGHQLARLRERGAHPAGAARGHGRPHRHRHRPPAEHGHRHGPPGRALRGAVVEEGDHDRCWRRGGTYAALWRKQSGGFLPMPEPSLPGA